VLTYMRISLFGCDRCLYVGMYLFPISTFFLSIIIISRRIWESTFSQHEFGHALTTKKLGGEVGGIILWPLGGFALCGPADGGASADFKVAIAGPLTHIPQMIVWVILYIAFTGGNISGLFSTSSVALYEVSYGGFTGFLSQLCKQTFWMNLHILGFNLFIPAFPLDGGRCLAASLVMCKVRVEKAAMITSVVAFVIAIGMGIWGFIPLIIGDDPNGLFMVFIAGFVLVSSKQLFDLTRAGRVREHPLFSRSCYDEREESSDNVEATEGTLT